MMRVLTLGKRCRLRKALYNRRQV